MEKIKINVVTYLKLYALKKNIDSYLSNIDKQFKQDKTIIANNNSKLIDAYDKYNNIYKREVQAQIDKRLQEIETLKEEIEEIKTLNKPLRRIKANQVMQISKEWCNYTPEAQKIINKICTKETAQ